VKIFGDTGLNNFFTVRERRMVMLFIPRESNFVGYFKQAIGRSSLLKPEKVTLFIHHDFVQFGKKHSRYTAILSFFTAVLLKLLL